MGYNANDGGNDNKPEHRQAGYYDKNASVHGDSFKSTGSKYIRVLTPIHTA
jgi:hypothetical protein